MVRTHALILATGTLLVASALSAQRPPSAATLDVARVQDSLVVLSDSSQWLPGLYAIHYLGKLPAPGGAPYFVFGAWPCTECDTGPDVFILRAHDTASVSTFVPRPGPQREVGDDEPYAETRLFVGRCSQQPGQVLISTWHELGVPATPDSIYTFIPSASRIRLVVTQQTAAAMRAIRRAVADGRCRELKGTGGTPRR